MHSSGPVSPYPNLLHNPRKDYPSPYSDNETMGGTTGTTVDGIGVLTYQRAIDIARNTEGELDPNVDAYLERAINDIWARINAQPNAYILSKDEFAVFNFYPAIIITRMRVARQWIGIGQPNMLQEARKPRTDCRLTWLQADDKEMLIRSVNRHADQETCVGYGAPAVPRFVGYAAGRSRLVKAATTILAILTLTLVKPVFCRSHDGFSPQPLSVHALAHHVRAVASSLLEDFQVYPPVLTVAPDGELEITDGSSNATVEIVHNGFPTCQETLVVYSFANSYGAPFVGEYTPPACSFNRVTWNLTVVSAGRQFDRLGIVYLGDIEVFRTSTAEPTQTGIEWTYLKDMTNFLPLFKQDQKIIFDLGNLISDIYTAPYNVTLSASFFNAEDSIMPADVIIPVSARQAAENMPSVFTVPPDTASNDLTFPRNVKKAVFTIAATGQIDEEFWWSNVLQSDVNTFPGLYGYSPFREVQLFIDGMLAGVAWPFPVIFTGGIVPGLWRPIVGIDAFDLKEDEIDISPWLPLLCDGNAHNFTIRVSGLNDNGDGTATLSETTGGYWLVTGKAFLWLDEEGHVTTGNGPSKSVPAPDFQVSSSLLKSANGTNETLLYHVSAQRSLSFRSTLHLSHGTEVASWQQVLTYSNAGNFSDQGNIEINDQQTNGFDVSSSGYARQISYPLYADTVFASFGDNISYVATVNRGKNVKTLGQPVFPTGLESFAVAEGVHPDYPRFEGASLSTTQQGSATYLANETAQTSFSYGTTEQDMVFEGIEVSTQRVSSAFPSITGSEELFHRHVLAVNSSIVEDEETLVNTPIGHEHGSHYGDGTAFVLSGAPGGGGKRAGQGGRGRI